MTKTKPFGLRIPLELHDKLEKISIYMNQSPNQVAIQAIEDWIDVVSLLGRWRIVMLSKEMLIPIFKLMSEEEIPKLASQSSEHIREILRDLVGLPMNETHYTVYINGIQDLFGEKNLNWFEKLTVKTKDTIEFSIRGFHYMGKPFSKYFSHILSNIMSTAFNLQMKTLTKYESNSIFLEFKKIEKGEK